MKAKPIWEQAAENPFRFFPLSEIADLFGFSPKVLTKLASLGAPIVARKCNPILLRDWIAAHHAKIGKIED